MDIEADDELSPSAVLSQSCFMPDLAVGRRDEAIRVMIEALARQHPFLDTPLVLESVLVRERVRATGTPEGVAFPHGKHNGLGGPFAAIAIASAAIDFGADHRLPCRILILTISSAYRSDGHLQFLGHMAGYLRWPDVRSAVLAARDKAAFLQALSAGGVVPV
jgi:mannitol/fructose-specific phosphotransferase system IIA component (Ntr-type)